MQESMNKSAMVGSCFFRLTTFSFISILISEKWKDTLAEGPAWCRFHHNTFPLQVLGCNSKLWNDILRADLRNLRWRLCKCSFITYWLSGLEAGWRCRSNSVVSAVEHTIGKWVLSVWASTLQWHLHVEDGASAWHLPLFSSSVAPVRRRRRRV